MRHRPPALMNLDEQGEEILGADEGVENGEDGGEKRILDVGALRAAAAGSTAAGASAPPNATAAVDVLAKKNPHQLEQERRASSAQ